MKALVPVKIFFFSDKMKALVPVKIVKTSLSLSLSLSLYTGARAEQ
jgi:hypothetical protein